MGGSWQVSASRRDFACSLNKMRTRGRGVKPIGEILRFVGHHFFAEFRDAHSVRWYAVIAKYEFGDPEIAAGALRSDFGVRNGCAAASFG
jgi:hypothetical protein